MAKDLVVENAQIAFRNFSGKAGQYNREGDRNFCLLLDEGVAETLLREGWNIKYLKPRDDGDEPRPYLQVKVSYANLPPKIVMITGKGQTILDEESISVLDFAEIDTIDLIVNPYEWEVQEKKGIKAYAKTMYVTLIEDVFASKYYDTPDSAANSMAANNADK